MALRRGATRIAGKYLANVGSGIVSRGSAFHDAQATTRFYDVGNPQSWQRFPQPRWPGPALKINQVVNNHESMEPSSINLHRLKRFQAAENSPSR